MVRFGVSFSKDLLDRFDKLIKERNYTNRSEALRDLIRQEFVKKEWVDGEDIAGAITLIYDHHKRDVLGKITGHTARFPEGDHLHSAYSLGP